MRPKEEIIFSEMSSTILIHAPTKDATKRFFCNDWFWHFNPRIRKGCDILIYVGQYAQSILIHASARDVTAKSHKIGSDFSVLFRKFMQKLGIAIFTISIF